MGQKGIRPACRDAVRGAAMLCVAAILLVYPRQSMQAARQGLSLCADTIVPSLFPFLVLSGMVIELGLPRYLGRALEGVMWPLFRVGGAGATALVLGLVGGYPVGARTAIELYQTGACGKAETERLLAFCNNSGPAFVLGVVGAGVFGSARAGLALYLVHIAASLCVGLLFRFYARAGEGEGTQPLPGGDCVVSISGAFTVGVRSALSGVLNICAFVVSFLVLLGLLTEVGITDGATRLLTWLGMEETQAQPLLRGLLEVSAGVSGLTGEGCMPLAAFLLGWAGVCVHCQVLCFLAESGLRIRTYLMGKLLHGALSALFMLGVCRWFPAILPASGWLGQPVERSFLPTLSVSMAAAWVLWMGFLLVAAVGITKTKKRGGKGRRIAV